MVRNGVLVVAGSALLLAPLLGTVSARALAARPAAGATVVVAPDCGAGYQCDNTSPGAFALDRTGTAARRADPGCAALELRSGRAGGGRYAWARLAAGAGCGRYRGWLDRSYDGGSTWQPRLGLFEDGGGEGYGAMYYWPHAASVRACAVREGGGRTICTPWQQA